MSYIGRQPSVGSFKNVDSITALQNNVRVTFPLTVTNSLVSYTLDPVSPLILTVVKNGLLLEPYTDFTVNNGNITFDSNPPVTTDTIWITTISEPMTIGTPSAGTVTDSMFAPGSIDYSNFTEQAKSSITADIITFGL